MVRRREIPEAKIHGDEKESQNKPGDDIDPVHVVLGTDGDCDMSDNFDMAQMKARFRAAHEEFSDLVGKLNSGELEESELPRIYELEREIEGIMDQISAENQRIREKIEEKRRQAKMYEMDIERLRKRAEFLEKRLKKWFEPCQR